MPFCTVERSLKKIIDIFKVPDQPLQYRIYSISRLRQQHIGPKDSTSEQPLAAAAGWEEGGGKVLIPPKSSERAGGRAMPPPLFL